jgi:hypothetical protein
MAQVTTLLTRADIDRVSHETIRQVLKKTKSSLGVTRDG